jgi:hypothetical protein
VAALEIDIDAAFGHILLIVMAWSAQPTAAK